MPADGHYREAMHAVGLGIRMRSGRDRDGPKRFGFLLLDNYPLLPVSGMIDVLRDSAYVTGEEEYEWCTISSTGGEVFAMNRFRTITDYTIDDAPDLDTLVVCAGLHGHLFEDARVFAWLKRNFARNVTIGAIATGSWVLAKAGLLTGRRCTLHWEDVYAFSETYPLIDITRDLYVFDGPVFTCSGGTGAIDMFLQIVADELGPDVSSAVARQIMHQSIRSGSESQPGADSPFRNIRHQSVRRVLKLMQDNVEQPLGVGLIARQAGISQKHLQRQFEIYFGTTPQLFYRKLRLEHARTLVRLTKLGLWEIALITGFSTTSYFSKCYRQAFGISPSKERRTLPKFALAAETAARNLD